MGNFNWPALLVSSGPIQIIDNGVSTPIEIDPANPDNNVKLPVVELLRAVNFAKHNAAAGADGNITTAAYTELVPALSRAVYKMLLYNTTGKIMILAVGGAGSEVDTLYWPPGVPLSEPQIFQVGQRISVKALDGTASVGYLIANFLG
jgi:hypothetical protein